MLVVFLLMKYEKRNANLEKDVLYKFCVQTRMYAKLKGVTLRGNFSKRNNTYMYYI